MWKGIQIVFRPDKRYFINDRNKEHSLQNEQVSVYSKIYEPNTSVTCW